MLNIKKRKCSYSCASIKENLSSREKLLSRSSEAQQVFIVVQVRVHSVCVCTGYWLPLLQVEPAPAPRDGVFRLFYFSRATCGSRAVDADRVCAEEKWTVKQSALMRQYPWYRARERERASREWKCNAIVSANICVQNIEQEADTNVYFNIVSRLQACTDKMVLSVRSCRNWLVCSVNASADMHVSEWKSGNEIPAFKVLLINNYSALQDCVLHISIVVLLWPACKTRYKERKCRGVCVGVSSVPPSWETSVLFEMSAFDSWSKFKDCKEVT